MRKSNILTSIVASFLFFIFVFSNGALANEKSVNTATNTDKITAVSKDNTETNKKQTDAGSDTSTKETVDVKILATTDLHTNLVNYDYYQDKPVETLGLSKTAVLIEKEKQVSKNVVLVDNGDAIQGTPLGTYISTIQPLKDGENHPMYKAMETLGFDAGTLGNHEFNYGLNYLDKVIKGTKIPLLNANVKNLDGTPRYKEYVILNKKFVDNNNKPVDFKVGITGIVPPQIMAWDKSNLEGKIVVEDAIEALKKTVPTLKKLGADLVVVLSHSGIGDEVYEKGEENVGYHVASIPGVDAVVTGHSHAEFPSGKGTGTYEKLPNVDGVKGTINGTPVVMAGKYGDHLGIINLKLEKENGKWVVKDRSGQIKKIDTKSPVSDERINELAKKEHQATVEYVRQAVGTTTADINSYFSLVKDDPSIQIVNNAQIWYAKKELKGTPYENLPVLSAAAPFKAGTRGDATAYTDIPKGGIAIKNVADLYLYDNVTAMIKVTGAELKEWLEMSSGLFKTVDPSSKEPQNIIDTDYRTYNFDVIDGVTYEFDITKPNKYDRNGKVVNADSSRVTNLKYNGELVDPKQEFVVITNNYRMNGSFPGVVTASVKQLLGLENRQVIINYLTEVKTINPTADNNWKFADTVKDLELRFLTAEKAKNLINESYDVKYLEPSQTAEGFGLYKYLYTENKVPSNSPVLEELPQGILKENKVPSNAPVLEELPQGVVKENKVPSNSPVVEELPTADVEVTKTTKKQANVVEKAEQKTTTKQNAKILAKTGSENTSTVFLGIILLFVAVTLRIKNRI